MEALATTNNLHGLLEDAIDSYGYELVHLELTGRDKNRVLRLYIDAPGGVNLDDCTFVSQQVSRLLDVEDPIQGQYTLEVSSPGIDRPLAKREHFENVVGQRIDVSTMIKSNGRKNFLGLLQAVENNTIVMDVDDQSYTIEMNNIRRANLRTGSDKLR